MVRTFKCAEGRGEKGAKDLMIEILTAAHFGQTGQIVRNGYTD